MYTAVHCTTNYNVFSGVFKGTNITITYPLRADQKECMMHVPPAGKCFRSFER